MIVRLDIHRIIFLNIFLKASFCMGFPNEDVDKLGNTGPRVRPYCTLQTKHNNYFEQVIGETRQHSTYLSTVNHVINVNAGQSL